MIRLPLECATCRRIEPDRAERIIAAVLINIQDWQDRTIEIADAALPVTGNKARALSLARDLENCRLSLERLAASLD